MDASDDHHKRWGITYLDPETFERDPGSLRQGRLSLAGATMGTVDVLLAGMAKARGETLVTGDRDFSAVRRDVRIRSYARSHR